MSKKKRSPKPKIKNLPRQVIEDLQEAEWMLDEHQPDLARQVLEELDGKYPGQSDILGLLMNAYADLENMLGYEWAVYRLIKIKRDDPDLAQGMAGAYIANFRPALAIQALQHLVQRWPEHEQATEAQALMVKIQDALMKEMGGLNLPEDETFDLALQNETVRFLLDHRQFEGARLEAEKILQKYPTFAPVLNNLSQTLALQGKTQQAVEQIQKVLATAPENVHALSNLARLQFLSNNQPEATQTAKRLIASRAPAADSAMKKAEALAYLADHTGVLALYKQAGREDKFALKNAIFLHLVAVSMYETGQEAKARGLWRKALKLNPAFDLVQKILDDLDQPSGKRNGPWAFPLYQWISESTLQELYQILKSATRRKDDRAVRVAGEGFLEHHPELIFLASHLLNRGDIASREFVLNLARIAPVPELLEALKEFALGQRGPDELRVQAANLLVENRVIQPGPVRMWINDGWTDMLLLDFDITDEVEHPIADPKVDALMRQAYEALQERDGLRAQQLLEKALAREPDLNVLRFNLATAYEIQGQVEKAHALIREIHEKSPDYFFGIAGVARLAIGDGDFDKARRLLMSLMQHTHFHVSEFEAMCSLQIELNLAEKNRDAARSWFDLWEELDPENPKLDPYRWRVGRGLSDYLKKSRLTE